MTTANAPQRRYTAPCPGCGAPVEFRAAQSTHAVCGFCQSTVVRQGDVLSRLGKMGELFDDHSPLQLFATGKFKRQNVLQTFTLIGRLQYKTSEGTWTEWNAFFDDGSTGWLAEDNGAYVFTQANAAPRELPAANRFTVGKQVTINSKIYSVASNAKATLISAQGELPKLPPLGEPFDVVELRNAMGEVLSIDYTAAPPVVSQGMAVMLDDLELKGLKDEKDGSVKDEKGRQFNCPHCGSTVAVTLTTSKSITCGSCNTLIDLSQGIGKELKSAIQEEPIQPLISLGTVGKLQGISWQVVGFQHRMGQEPDDPDEQFGWSEYLLYNQKRGFSFLVDSEEGWSIVRPATGAPTVNGKTASYQGKSYTLKYSYQAETEYVCGEFYWLVQRGQKTQNQDFANGKNLLSLEQSANEAVWSAGSTITSDAVAKAFNLDAKRDLFKRDDVSPLSSASQIGINTIVILVILTIVVITLLSTCSSDSSTSSGARTSGGSYGGTSGGGGHK